MTDLYGIILVFALLLLLSPLMGPYLARVILMKRTKADILLDPLDRFLYRLSGIDPSREMNWKAQLKALLMINALWLLICLFVLLNMSWLPLNPDAKPSMSADLAFNTAVSFITNTNLQHYSGEQSLSHLGQLVLMLWQFLSAACGIAICGMVFLSMREEGEKRYGNFYVLLVRSITRILLPLSVAIAILLVLNGSPMTFSGRIAQVDMEGRMTQVSTGPVAAFVAIKQCGTNGGGFFGANSGHPFENPNYFTNLLENLVILLIPASLVFAMGEIIGRRKFAWMTFGVMTAGMLLFLIPAVMLETNANPALEPLGVSQSAGNMEGKEIRFGAAASANWMVYTTCSSNGSVNAMHDSMYPLSGMFALLGMMLNCLFGGVGVGFLNFYVFLILAVFISGLMVGRTPEFLGRKIEAREMKIAMLVALLHPFLILTGTAVSASLASTNPEFMSGLGNTGFHGFSEMLYEFSSGSANNGSGFEGLSDNTPFWNISCGIIMLIARYLPIIGPVAIAGSLAAKRHIPAGAGTLSVDSGTFGLMVFAVILIVAALAFFPALALGPIAEHVSTLLP